MKLTGLLASILLLASVAGLTEDKGFKLGPSAANSKNMTPLDELAPIGEAPPSPIRPFDEQESSLPARRSNQTLLDDLKRRAEQPVLGGTDVSEKKIPSNPIPASDFQVPSKAEPKEVLEQPKGATFDLGLNKKASENTEENTSGVSAETSEPQPPSTARQPEYKTLPRATVAKSGPKDEGSLNMKSNSDSSPPVIKGAPNGMMALALIALAMGLGFCLWWWKRTLSKGLANAGLPIVVLGQSHLDATTRILLLKVGQKVLVVAKSASFCSTLDVISDSDEVKLLTLGAGTDDRDEGFHKLMGDMKTKHSKDSAKTLSQSNKEEKGIRQELEDLKSQLQNLR